MNEIVARAAPASAPIGHGGSLIPRTLAEAMRLAEVMASAKMVPNHLQGDVGSCFMIVEQSQRWGMSPFAVAQGTSNIGGKLCYEGKVIAAALNSTGAIVGEFDYEFMGDPKKPETLSVLTSAVRASDGQRKSITLAWVDAKTKNGFWTSQPEQQLCYASSRVWARRWTPGPLLGVYSPEEAEQEFAGTTIEGAAETQPPAPAAEPPPVKRTALMFLTDLETEFNGAESVTELEEICERAANKKGIGMLGVGGKEKFKALLDAALDRVRATDAPVPEHVATARRISEETDAMLDKGVWPGEGT